MIDGHLRRFRVNPRYVVLDCEGESLNLAATRPFQICWAIADNREIKSIHSHYIAWSDIDVSPTAAMITRFNLDHYRSVAEPAREVWDRFNAAISVPGTEIVWQNGLHYDQYCIKNWKRGVGLPYDQSFTFQSIDTKALTQALAKNWAPDVSSPSGFLSWQYRAASYTERGLKSNLAYCAGVEGIEYDPKGLHDASADTVLTAQIFHKRLFQLNF